MESIEEGRAVVGCAVGVSQKKVTVHNLEIGMFVSDLDRPWHQTPFPIQGFFIRTQDDIRSLTSHCSWVMVDVAETRDTSEYNHADAPVYFRRQRRTHAQEVIKLPPINIKNPVRYVESRPLRKEVKGVTALAQDVDEALVHVGATIRQHGQPDLKPLAGAVQKMTASVIRNPDALLWLSRVREHDDYSYRHAMNSAVWALVCGRHLGLESGLLNHLAMGCLLAHIGKADLPEEILANEHALSAAQYAEYKTYVERGVAQLASAGLSRAVINIVQNHRERHNGTGFPEGVRGDRIPLLAKIAGLVDYYETLVEPREGCVPMTPAQAVGHLYETRNIEFQEDLVERFIQAIGVYPIGTLVELSDGQRGVILSHSPDRRLLPKVMVMTDHAQRPLKTAKVINLAEHNTGRTRGKQLRIEGCLPNGTDGLDPNRYDISGAELRFRIRNLFG